MPALHDLEKKLKTDFNFRKEFVRDPVGTLHKEGLDLPGEVAKQIEAQMKNIRTKNPDGQAAVSISVGIEY